MKIWNRRRHEKVFFFLTATIMLLAGGLHLCRIVNSWDLTLGPLVIPLYISYLAVFITAMMLIMGLYYLLR